MDRTEKENDGQYAEDHKEDYEEKKLTFSQKLHQLSARINRFAESIELEPNWSRIRKWLIKNH